MKAYAISEPFHEDDPHEFYYFDYKRLVDREKLCAHRVAIDLEDLLNEESGNLLKDINRNFVEDFGFLPRYKDDSIEYYIKKKRVARFMIDFHTLEVVLILKLKDMDKYIDLIEMLPDDLRKHFEKGNYRYCGFQNATADYCKFRISWTFRDRTQNACGVTVFNFRDPRKSDCRFFVDLMKSEYNYN